MSAFWREREALARRTVEAMTDAEVRRLATRLAITWPVHVLDQAYRMREFDRIRQGVDA